MTIRKRLLLLLLPPLTAFLIFDALFFYFHWSREILLFGSSILLFLVIGIVFLITDRISKPVRKLNQAALEIAAGDYEAHIQVDGPKEIKELAQTLNTMNQCLVEHMSRLKESSLIRERMYGEYECSLLLQYYMLDKVIEDFQDPAIKLKLISIPQSRLENGLFFNIEPDNDSIFFHLFEANEEGFESLFKLNREEHPTKNIHCSLSRQKKLLEYRTENLFSPLVWSVKQQFFKRSQQQRFLLDNLDLVFLYNSSVIEHFIKEENVEEWLSKVLRHFSEDGLEAISLMLTNELKFIAKKQHVKHDFKIICMQL